MTTPTRPTTPAMLRVFCRNQLLEDCFVASWLGIAHEDTLRSMAGWMLTSAIFSDETVCDMWRSMERGHSTKGQKAHFQWMLLNNAAVSISDQTEVEEACANG